MISGRAGKPVRVVELFTSQGCNNSPPADSLLRTLGDRDDLLTLSWPVDYWDRMGWVDTFGDPQHSRRQRAYNKRIGRSGVYTPQVIIDGRYQMVGGNRRQIEATLDTAPAVPGIEAPMMTATGNTIEVDLFAAKLDSPIAVRLVWYLSEASVAIQRGENRGRELVYTNIVRHSELLDSWDGQERTLTLDIAAGEDMGADHMAILLHDRYGEGEILAATSIALSDPALSD